MEDSSRSYDAESESSEPSTSTLKVIWPVLKSILEILIDVVL